MAIINNRSVMGPKATVRKFLIATHGAFAEGIRSSLDIIIGKTENLALIQAYMDENKSIDQELDSLIGQREENEEWVVFTDLLGGSITNQIVRYAAAAGKSGAVSPKIHIVAGFNLPLLIEIILSDPDSPAEEVIREAVSKAREQLVYVNELLISSDNKNPND